MKLWLDSTNSETILKAKKLGILFGITTNPSIIAESGQSLAKNIKDLLDIQEGPIAVQVIAQDYDGMVDQAKKLYAFSNRIIVKIPVSEIGLEVIKQLTNINIPVMATTIFLPHQALMAAKVGAKYVAPYVGQIEKNGGDPWMVLMDILQIYHHYSIKTEVLAASIPTIDHFHKCAILKVPHITLKQPIFQELIKTVPATQDWMNRFTTTWKNANLTFLMDNDDAKN